ncbi:GspH/FimT family pseudopilin [Guyparkeria hydrothermalis]|uniref:GspH/FimT family pseudopilin n=1 Tax=Guyparkeria hydrothermalis TaxID=923 RepID=UPI002021AEB3|nr:GspH/FimT family pseudopilin [Guyparkeria hydrothermalis]MCL7745064.1 GspH/FimT family pseudopilin [Guyparkeria hydrothermalis]
MGASDENVARILRHERQADRSSAESSLSSAGDWQVVFVHGYMQCVEKELNGMNRNLVHPLRRSRHHGFSLIELMVTIVVAAVLLAIAIPGFGNLILSNRLTTVTNEWVTAVNVARSEAIKRNAAVAVCGATGDDGTALTNGCATQANWGEVRASNPDGSFDVVRASLMGDIPTGISMASTKTLRFGGNGIGRQESQSVPEGDLLIADISATDLGGNNHRCIHLITGTTVNTVSSDTCGN